MGAPSLPSSIREVLALEVQSLLDDNEWSLKQAAMRLGCSGEAVRDAQLGRGGPKVLSGVLKVRALTLPMLFHKHGKRVDFFAAALGDLSSSDLAALPEEPGEGPLDTLAMARIGADRLYEEKGVPRDTAWILMREVELNEPTPDRFFEEGWRRALERIHPGSTEAPYDRGSRVDERSGSKDELVAVEPGTSQADVEKAERAHPKVRKPNQKRRRG